MRKGDARRGELLAAAERLFYTKGYEKTSVQDILNELHFSKGGFYHYFDSKLAVLEAICEQRAQECCEQARTVAQRQGPAVDKLNAVFHASTLLNDGNDGFVALMIQVAYREDGALMREKMKACQLESMRQPVTEVIAEGAASGEFFVQDAAGSAELLIRLYLQFTDEIAFLLAQEESEERLAEAIVKKLNLYRMAIERVLVAPFGSVVLFEAKELQLLGQSVLRGRVRRRADAMLGNG